MRPETESRSAVPLDREALLKRPVTGVEVEFRDGETIVSSTDPQGRITYANGYFIEISGYTEAELIGQGREQLILRNEAARQGHLAGGGVAGGRERVDAVAHLPRLDREHAAELTAAQHTERRARVQHTTHGSEASRTAAVWASRNACSR